MLFLRLITLLMAFGRLISAQPSELRAVAVAWALSFKLSFRP